MKQTYMVDAKGPKNEYLYLRIGRYPTKFKYAKKEFEKMVEIMKSEKYNPNKEIAKIEMIEITSERGKENKYEKIYECKL